MIDRSGLQRSDRRTRQSNAQKMGSIGLILHKLQQFEHTSTRRVTGLKHYHTNTRSTRPGDRRCRRIDRDSPIWPESLAPGRRTHTHQTPLLCRRQLNGFSETHAFGAPPRQRQPSRQQNAGCCPRTEKIRRRSATAHITQAHNSRALVDRAHRRALGTNVSPLRRCVNELACARIMMHARPWGGTPQQLHSPICVCVPGVINEVLSCPSARCLWFGPPHATPPDTRSKYMRMLKTCVRLPLPLPVFVCVCAHAKSACATNYASDYTNRARMQADARALCDARGTHA